MTLVSELLHQHPTASRLAVQALDARRTALTYLQAARRRVRPAQPGFLLSGLLRGRTKASALYIGGESFLRDVDQTFFANQARNLELGSSAIESARSGVDFVVTEAWPWETAETSSHPIVQPWLDARCDPGRDFDQFLRLRVSETVRRSLRKAQARRLEFVVDPSAEAAVRFLREVVAPMARASFGEEAIVGPEERVLAWGGPSTQISTLEARQAGVRVGGAVLLTSEARRELLIHSYGLPPAVHEDKKARSEIMAALNGWAYRTACSNGWTVNMGLTRPFPDHGVFNHKRQWGCRLAPVSRYPRFRIDFAASRSRLLGHAPLFYLGAAGSIRAVAQFTPHSTDAAKELTERIHGWVCAGLAELEVLVPAALVSELSAARAPNGCQLTLVTH